MTGLAFASVRSRIGSLGVVALSVFLGATIMTGFTSMIETSGSAAATDGDVETLFIMGTVVGSWGVVIVLFSVASTLTVAISQRTDEITLLRSVGATRRQVRTLVRRETAVVALVASAAGLLPGALLGSWLLDRLVAAGMITDGVEYRLGVVTAVTLVVAIVGVSLGAASLAARRALRGLESPREPSRLGRGRIVLGILFAVASASQIVLTLTVGATSDDPFTAMQFGGSASITASMSLALLSPPILRAASRLVPSRSVAGTLARAHLGRRAVAMSAALAPVLVFVGIGIGTWYLMAVHAVADTADVEGAEEVVFINYVVVGMIAAFAAIMAVNTLVAVTLDRRDELARLRVSGATRGELTRSVAVEGLVLAGVGSALGAAASLATIIPFTVVKTDGWLPADGPWPGIVVVLAAVVVTLGSSVLAVRRAVRGPASAVLAAA